MLSFTISIYLGSKIFSGTAVFGKIIKLLKGNTGIIFGSSEDDILYSGGYLLNDDYEGGEFILDGETLDKEIGELFTFKRDVPHEVLPVTKGVRLSLHFSVREKKDGNNI